MTLRLNCVAALLTAPSIEKVPLFLSFFNMYFCSSLDSTFFAPLGTTRHCEAFRSRRVELASVCSHRAGGVQERHHGRLENSVLPTRARPCTGRYTLHDSLDYLVYYLSRKTLVV